MEPIPLSKFSDYVQDMHKDRDFGFETEYNVSLIYTCVYYSCCAVF